MNNWTSINSLHLSNIDVNSYIAENASIDEKIDLVIVFNSCESRALEYLKLFKTKQIETALLINFHSDDEKKKENYIINKTELTSRVKGKIIELNDNIDIFNFQDNIQLILNSIPQGVIFYGAKWFLDITGEPSIYSVALLKAIKKIFPSPTLILFNVSGIYDSKEPNVHKHFSEGIKGDIYIPYYYGRPDFSKPWKYIFLLGFEGERSLSILKKCEPLSSEVITAKPGYLDTYTDQALKNNNCFLRELGIYDSKHEIHFIDIGDIVTVYWKLDEIYQKVKGNMNLCLVPLGPKPHSIAAGLFALINDEISIMYQVPQKYNLKESKRSRYIWLYEIK